LTTVTPQENVSIVATTQKLNILRGELARWQDSPNGVKLSKLQVYE